MPVTDKQTLMLSLTDQIADLCDRGYYKHELVAFMHLDTYGMFCLDALDIHSPPESVKYHDVRITYGFATPEGQVQVVPDNDLTLSRYPKKGPYHE